LVSFKEVLQEIRYVGSGYPFSFSLKAWYNYVVYALKAGLRIPLLITSGLGIIYSIFKKEKFDILILIMFVIYFFLVASFSKDCPAYSMIRFGLFLIPLLLFFTARFIVDIIKKIKLLLPILVLIIGYTLLYSLSYSINCAVDAGNNSTRIKAGEWINTYIKKGASIGVGSIPEPYRTPPFKFKDYEIVIINDMKLFDELALKTQLPEYFVIVGNLHPLYHKNLKNIINLLKNLNQ
jgi:hypothetical protein